MPQMAPINWLSLYFVFIIIFIMFIIVNYFMFLYPPKSYKKKTLKKLHLENDSKLILNFWPIY